MRSKIIILIIISVILRFYLLGIIPRGFSSDEAALGYNAYSILKTGRDEYGVSCPISFKSFGEYKAPFYIYASILPISIFGLNEFGARFSSAILGVLLVVLVYFFTREILSQDCIAFSSALIFSLLPWHLQFSRIAYEGNGALLFICIGAWFFLKGLKKGRFLVLSVSFFILSLYTHYGVRMFTPLFLIYLLISYRRIIVRFKKEMFLSFFLGLVLLFPILPHLFSESGFSRASYTSFLSDEGMIFAINEKRAEHIWSGQNNSIIHRLIHNKITEYSKKFIDNYFSHFDFSFLFKIGDKNPFFRTPNNGPLLYSLLPFLLFGFYRLLMEKRLEKKIIFAWIFLAPIPSSMTRLEPSANRIFIIVIPIAILIGLGIVSLWHKLLSRKSRYLLIMLGLFFVLEYFAYLDNYYTHLSVKYARETKIEVKNTIKMINRFSSNYQQVWITTGFGDYIYFLFYLKYPPGRYQKEAKLSLLDEYGFGHVERFDKYFFGKIPKYFDFSKKILYIASPDDIGLKINPLDKTFYPDGQDAFLLLDTEIIKQHYPLSSLEYKPINKDIYGNMIVDGDKKIE